MARFVASIAVCMSKNLSRACSVLPRFVGTGEHFNKRSPLLDQSRRAFLRLSVCSSLIIASHGPSLGRLSGATIADHVVDKLMIVPKFGSVSV